MPLAPVHTLVLLSLASPRIRAWWERCDRSMEGTDEIAGLLASLLRHGDSPLHSVMRQGLRSTSTWEAACDHCLVPAAPAESALLPGLHGLLQELTEAWPLEAARGSQADLELLCYLGLRRLAAPAVHRWREVFDLGRLQAALGQAVAMSRKGNAPSETRGATATEPPLLSYYDLRDLPGLEPLDVAAERLLAAWHEPILEGVARILHRRQVRHCLLVGDPGVGKPELLAQFARKARAGSWPKLANLPVLMANCRWVPPEEARHHLGELLARIRHENVVLAVEGWASIARDEQGRSLRPLLLSRLHGSVGRLVGLLTPREYEDWTSDPSSGEFFEAIRVEEPDPATAEQLIRRWANSFGPASGVPISPAAVRCAVRLATQFVLHDHLPGKAMALLAAAVDDEAFRREFSAGHDGTAQNSPGLRPELSDQAVVAVAARSTGLPVSTLSGVGDAVDYAASLRTAVLGQEAVLGEVATELGLIRAGMVERGKPASVLMFLGPTGTGKTELAKALARLYSPSRRLKVYTLGNCVEPHSVSTLIGVPPGYVGHDQGGKLVNDLNAEPYSVVLLDEADKAHPDVLQPFLNLFDEGWLVDQRGTRAYGDKAIFILTSNVGQRMLIDLVKQGKPWNEVTERMKEVVTQIKHSKSSRPVFSAEFLARIRRFLVFRPLEESACKGIVAKQLAELQERWRERRGKRLEIDALLVERLAHLAWDRLQQSQGREGARLVRKLVADEIEGPLQRWIGKDLRAYQHAGRLVIHAQPDPGSADLNIVIDWGP